MDNYKILMLDDQPIQHLTCTTAWPLIKPAHLAKSHLDSYENILSKQKIHLYSNSTVTTYLENHLILCVLTILPSLSFCTFSFLLAYKGKGFFMAFKYKRVLVDVTHSIPHFCPLPTCVPFTPPVSQSPFHFHFSGFLTPLAPSLKAFLK